MARRRIPITKVGTLFAEGNGVSEIAKKTGFTKGAISKALKKLKPNLTKAVAVHHAREVVERGLDAYDQLRTINNHANEILDLLMRWNRGDDEALRILESQVRKVKVRGSEEEITEYKFKDPRELALKAMAEIRGQLSLQLDIFKVWEDHKALAQFENEMLQAIRDAEQDIECPKCGESIQTRLAFRIIENIKKTGTVYPALE